MKSTSMEMHIGGAREDDPPYTIRFQIMCAGEVIVALEGGNVSDDDDDKASRPRVSACIVLEREDLMALSRMAQSAADFAVESKREWDADHPSE